LHKEHDIYVCCTKIAALLLVLERHDQSIRVYERALALAMRLYGASSSPVSVVDVRVHGVTRRRVLQAAVVLGNLANALNARENYAEATAMHERALLIKQRIFGAESLPVAETLEAIGRALVHQHRYRDALDKFDAAVVIYTDLTKCKHANYAHAFLMQTECRKAVERETNENAVT
jgi:tetratricopeptide (TPR) repeat protein